MTDLLGEARPNAQFLLPPAMMQQKLEVLKSEQTRLKGAGWLWSSPKSDVSEQRREELRVVDEHESRVLRLAKVMPETRNRKPLLPQLLLKANVVSVVARLVFTQSIATAICLAVKNGRSPACRPSIVRSSTRILPLSRRILSAPICSGRSMYLEPASSALARRAGPRSIVIEVTIAAASRATTMVRQTLT